MRYYLKAEYRACISALKGLPGAETRYKLIRDANSIIIKCLYYHLQNGGCAYQQHKGRLLIFHPSPRGTGITYSHFALIKGKWEATSHADHIDDRKLERELIKGKYVNLLA